MSARSHFLSSLRFTTSIPFQLRGVSYLFPIKARAASERASRFGARASLRIYPIRTRAVFEHRTQQDGWEQSLISFYDVGERIWILFYSEELFY